MKYSASRAASRNPEPVESTGTSSKPGGVISTAMSNTGLGNFGEKRILVAMSGTGLRSDDADERDALARRAAEVVGEGQLPAAADAGDLALAGLAAQLQPALEEHAQPGGADRVAERLQPAVGIDRELAVEIVGAGQHVLPRGAATGELEILHQHQLGRREAVVHLGHGQFLARVLDAGLGVGVGGGGHDLGAGRVVVALIDQPRSGPGHE